MEKNYEINEETLRCDLEEILDWLKEDLMTASKNVPITEQGKRAGSSEFSQVVDAYKKVWEIYQAKLDSDADIRIKQAEIDRKNCEYLENVAKRTEELKLREKEFELKSQEILDNARARNRELEVKDREADIKELSAKESGRWWNKPLVQTGMICLTTLTVNGIALYLNATEAPLKNIFERWMIRPKL